MSPHLNAEQRFAVQAFIDNPLCVINGGPGTGKTTVVEHLIIEGQTTLFVAPTGCAAVRLQGATKMRCYVMAQIGYDSDLLKKYTGCNMVIDEGSMTNVECCTSLILFLHPRRLVVVGDAKQMPSITSKPLLNTLLRCLGAFVVTNLVHNHRQLNLNSSLVWLINALGTPVMQDFAAVMANCHIVRKDKLICSGGDGSVTLDFCLTHEEAEVRAANAYLTPKKKQMLAPNGATVTKLNLLTQSSQYQTVVCNTNLYDKKQAEDEDGKVMLVANGVTGEYEKRPKGDRILYTNGFIDTETKRGFRSQWEAARCMTVHKAQGNEFSEEGIVVLTKWYGPLPLELLFTAVSRFKTKVTIYGMENVIRTVLKGAFNTENVQHDLIEIYR
jgi:exodeoxyribonuclease V alpha subunit